jgi:hypothetical protein
MGLCRCIFCPQAAGVPRGTSAAFAGSMDPARKAAHGHWPRRTSMEFGTMRLPTNPMAVFVCYQVAAIATTIPTDDRGCSTGGVRPRSLKWQYFSKTYNVDRPRRP